jgi:hypothetical protein
MSLFTRLLVTAGLGTAIYLAPPAAADTPDCGRVSLVLCRLVPVLPDLDHDVDLTEDPWALYPKAPASVPPDAETPNPETPNPDAPNAGNSVGIPNAGGASGGTPHAGGPNAGSSGD